MIFRFLPLANLFPTSLFFLKKIRGRGTFYGAILGEAGVLLLFYLNMTGVIELAYLWLNLIGCVMVIFFALLIQTITKGTDKLNADKI